MLEQCGICDKEQYIYRRIFMKRSDKEATPVCIHCWKFPPPKHPKYPDVLESRSLR